MEILIHRNGQRLGPFTMEEITEYLETGVISQDDDSWAEGREGWVPLKNLLAAVNPPPPPPGREVKSPIRIEVLDTSQKTDIHGLLLLGGIVFGMIIFIYFGYTYFLNTISKYHWPGQPAAATVTGLENGSIPTLHLSLNTFSEGFNSATMDGKTVMNFYLQPGTAQTICQKILDKVKTNVTDNTDVTQLTIHVQIKTTPPVNVDFAVSDSADHIRAQPDFLTGPSPTRDQILGVLHIAGVE